VQSPRLSRSKYPLDAIIPGLELCASKAAMDASLDLLEHFILSAEIQGNVAQHKYTNPIALGV